MRHLSESEIKNVSGGFLGSLIKTIDTLGRLFTIKEIRDITFDHFNQANVKQVNDFKKDPSTVTDRFSSNGDL